MIARLRRRYMTLLELMIALSLTVALLIILGYFYRQAAWLDDESERIQKVSFQSRYVETRLMQVIPMIERYYYANGDTKNAHYYFFSDNGFGGGSSGGGSSLVFVYKTYADVNLNYAFRALGRLFIDKNNRLMLATWSAPETWEEMSPTKAKLEVLLENVKDLKFQFFNPPAKNQKKADDQLKPLKELVPSAEGWLDEWKQENHFLPPLMKMMVTYKPLKEEQTVTYAFPLPQSTKMIVYEQNQE